MSKLFSLVVDRTGIAKTHVLDDTGERDPTYLDNQMYVICHEAIGKDAMPVSFNTFLKQKTETAPIRIREKDILACVTPKDHMVTGARVVDSCFTCHQYFLISKHPLVKPDPVMTRDPYDPVILFEMFVYNLLIY